LPHVPANPRVDLEQVAMFLMRLPEANNGAGRLNLPPKQRWAGKQWGQKNLLVHIFAPIFLPFPPSSPLFASVNYVFARVPSAEAVKTTALSEDLPRDWNQFSFVLPAFLLIRDWLGWRMH
jgi:hypothetical protein